LGCSCALVLLCCFVTMSNAGSVRTFDTLLLVDSSSSARDRDKYDLIRRFVATLSEQLLKTKQHRVAIVSFSDVVYRLILKFTDNPKQMNEGLKNLNKTGGFSYVTDDVIVKMFNTSKLGDGKQVVTVLGRNPENSDAISKTAKSLKSRGLEMYSVGVGPDFFKNTKDLRALSSVPLKDHTLRTTYGSLLKATPVMLKKLQTDAKATTTPQKIIGFALKTQPRKAVQQHHLTHHKAHEKSPHLLHHNKAYNHKIEQPKAKAQLRLQQQPKQQQPQQQQPKSQAHPQPPRPRPRQRAHHHHNHHHHHHHSNPSIEPHLVKSQKVNKAPRKHKTIRSRPRSPQHVWGMPDPSQLPPEARPFTDEKNAPSEAGLMNIMDVTEKDASYDRTTTNVATNLLLDYFGSGISTVGTPNTASPDMSNLITNNTKIGDAPSCVGSVPIDNRILTNGTMVTGIVPTGNQNTTAAASRNCGDASSVPVEEGISTGESGIDATWDYGKKKSTISEKSH